MWRNNYPIAPKQPGKWVCPPFFTLSQEITITGGKGELSPSVDDEGLKVAATVNG